MPLSSQGKSSTAAEISDDTGRLGLEVESFSPGAILPVSAYPTVSGSWAPMAVKIASFAAATL
jgi:hypothetical protein